MNLHYFPNSIFLNILNVFRCFLTYFGIDIFGGDRSHDFCIQHLSGPAEQKATKSVCEERAEFFNVIGDDRCD